MFPSFGGFSTPDFATSIRFDAPASFSMGSLQYGNIVSGIADFEGYYPGSRAYRNNNPGNILYGPFASSHGATGADMQGFATFPNAQSGFSATDALVGKYAQQGLSLRQLVDTWNPPNAPGNSPAINLNYTNAIAGKSGINPDTPIGNAAGSGLFSGLLGNALGGALFPELKMGYDLFGAVLPKSLNPFASITDSFSWGRVAAFLIGVVLIGSGLFMFQPVHEIVVKTGRRVAEGAEVIGA